MIRSRGVLVAYVSVPADRPPAADPPRGTPRRQCCRQDRGRVV